MLTDRLKSRPILLLATGLIAAMIATIAFGLIVLRDNQSEVVVIYGRGATDLTVDVRGAVNTPGVYTLPAGSRVGDAIDAAGGLTSDADIMLVNRARRLDDAELLIIPVLVAKASPVGQSDTTAAASSDGALGVGYRVNINLATQAELESLPGIGPVIAGRIIVFRTQQGPFTDIDQLLDVDGISENLLAEIQSLITVGP